jgi:hypothetical protein
LSPDTIFLDLDAEGPFILKKPIIIPGRKTCFLGVFAGNTPGTGQSYFGQKRW